VHSKPTPLFRVFDWTALDGLLFRSVKRCPPSLEDFLSYEALGLLYDRRDYFKGVGVSTRRTREQGISAARRYGHGRAVAAVDLRGAPVAWARTGSRGHVTVWAPAELLLRAVVQCDEHE
jgi:hypothetical protein